MEVIKKEIELDENHGYEYRIALPMTVKLREISEAVVTSTIPWQAIAVYKFAYHHPYHNTDVYEFVGVELR